MQIYRNGVISFGSSLSSKKPEDLQVPGTATPFIAGFGSDLTRNAEIAITERNLTSTDYSMTKSCMCEFLCEGFSKSVADCDPTHILIVTWKDATHTLNEVRMLIF